MTRTWIFRQTEIRKPKDNTEIVDFEGFPTMVSELLYPHKEYPILTLEVFESDPMEKLKNHILSLLEFIPDGWEMPLGWSQIAAEARKAVGK